ncbi:hypothetical protein HDU77_011518 [Chytriomyces hyalinus]|nr:hypothetical protein HDU77_011518 [Chytriomyces hyalinus]
MPEPTVPVPIVTTSTPTQLLTTSQIIQSFYPKNMHASLLKGHDEKMMRLGAPPYWLVHPGTPIDETVNQVSYDAVVGNLQAAEEVARAAKKVKMATSLPGKRNREKLAAAEEVAQAAKKVKVDTSLPGKRKREKLAAAAAAATLSTKTGEPLSETVVNVKMFLDIATKDISAKCSTGVCPCGLCSNDVIDEGIGQKKCLEYIAGLDVIFVYQKQNVDSNWLKSLLGDQLFNECIQPKIIDFQCTFVELLHYKDNIGNIHLCILDVYTRKCLWK